MAKVYLCDACGEVVKDPWTTKMKEFYVETDITGMPLGWTKRVKIHLCAECYEGLHELAKRKSKGAQE